MNKNNIQPSQDTVSVLSLFDGMSCGMIAMLNAGVKVGSYAAYEIDKYAIKTSQHNFPDILQCGDVFEADFTQHKGVDYLIGGSPCTYWSIAKTTNRETEARGTGWELFSQYIRALNEAQPRYFIYENNKSMSKQIRASIDAVFGFEAICINSALLSAQNRKRLYWVGKRNDDGSYSKVDVYQPEDKGILLKGVLDGISDRDKARAVIGSIGRTTTREYFLKHQGTMAFTPINTTVNGKAQALRASCYKDGIRNMIANNVDRRTCVAEPVNTVNGKSQTIKAQYQNTNVDNICCYSSTYGASGVAEPVRVEALPIEFENNVPIKAKSYSDGKTYAVYEVKDGLITIKGKEYSIKLSDGFYIIRKLTVSECKKLQTVPEWYEFPVSDTQAYKMLGDGWTCDVITYLIKAIIND